MKLKVNKITCEDNIIDYGNGYTAGAVKATSDFKLEKKDKQPGGTDTEYNRGYKDGYVFTYKKCQSKAKMLEDDLTKMLKQCLIN